MHYSLFTQRMAYGLSEQRIDAFYRELSKLILPDYLDDSFNDTLDVLKQLNYTVDHLMFNLMDPCIHFLHYCSWLGKRLPCEQIFRVATSAEGFCCSFNYNPHFDDFDV